MRLRDRIARLRKELFRGLRSDSGGSSHPATRRRIVEPLERRTMLAADAAQVGVLYTETDDHSDNQPDTFEVSFVGGAPSSELTRLEIDMSPKRLFFDTAETGRGANGAHAFQVVSMRSQSGAASVSASVTDGASVIVLQFANFRAGDKLVFSIDVDEDETLVPATGIVDPGAEPNIDSIASGAEINDSILRAEFVAPHFRDAAGTGTFKHKFNLSGRGFDLTLDANPKGTETRRAAAAVSAIQAPLPIAISGTVYLDHDMDLSQDGGDPGLSGVTLELWKQAGGTFVATGLTTQTNSSGDYEFGFELGLLPGTYGVREQQPSGLFSVGAVVGTVEGTQSGSTDPADRDWLTQIEIPLGGTRGVDYDFAEIAPASLSGHVHLSDRFGNCDEEDEDVRPLENVRVVLLDAKGQTVAETRTDADGEYTFANLLPGVYSVIEFTPDGLIDGEGHAGSSGGQFNANGVHNINLTSGTHAKDYDFCEHEPASLSGFVYHDQNNDGVRQATETPIAGTTVQLLDGSGAVVASTLTLADGSYRFDNLKAGTYRLVELQPTGWLDGRDAAGTIAGSVVGAAQNPGDAIRDIQLLWGDEGVEYDFGELLPGSIAGMIHADKNQNCRLDEGETPLGGVRVDLLDAQGKLLMSTTTDSQGRYRFEGLAPGQYAVHEHQPAGYFHGGQDAGSGGGDESVDDFISAIQLGSGEELVDYNFCEVPPASISGFVHVDRDGDCVFDPDEQPLSGVRIDLLDTNGAVVATTTTNATGFYQFDNLIAGEYSVREHQPAGYFHGGQEAGSGGGDDSQNDLISSIQLTAGADFVHYDFCEVPPSSLSGFVFIDANSNCRFESGESPIAGVRVDLLDANGAVVASTTTNSAGAYQFEQLRPGEYSVREHQPSGVFHGGQTAGSGGGDDSQDDLISAISIGAGVDLVHYDFCEVAPASLSGYVHVDSDGDCEFDPGEQPLEGVVMELLDESGAVVASTETDGTGFYKFENLRPGVYSVRETQPDDYFNGGQDVGRVLGGAATTAAAHGDDEHGDDEQGGLIGAQGGLSIGGQLDGGLESAGNADDASAADGSVPNLISNIVIGAGEQHVEYNYCELPAASLSGRVFQDGDVIRTANGQLPSDLRSVRDGQFTSDDKPIAGVVLELRNGISGDPIDASDALPGHYPAGPIRTTTDSQGRYEFTGLPAGNYAVYEIHPSQYSDGIDTPGTTSGIAINPSDNVSPQLIRRLSKDPVNDAIILIPLGTGQHSADNNFSEVRVESQPPPPPPISPPPGTPSFPPRAFATPSTNGAPSNPPGIVSPNVTPIGLTIGGGGMHGHTWHLSVINAGSPRGDLPAGMQSVIVHPASFLSTRDWVETDMRSGQWTLIVNSIGEPAERRLHTFGMKGAIPISGDFNGDGADEIGVYFHGRWFLDLNGDGAWDEEDLWAQLGTLDDQPVTGDWDGDGKDDIGIFGPEWPGDPRALSVEAGLPDPLNTRQPRPKNIPPKLDDAPDERRLMKRSAKGTPREDVIDHVFRYGHDGDRAIAGDWNGDGISSVGVFRGGKWILDMDGDGRWSRADVVAYFGEEGDRPVVGDFNGDGIDEIGVYRDGLWIIDADGNRRPSQGDRKLRLGEAADTPVVGDWNGDGVDEPGLYRDAVDASADDNGDGEQGAPSPERQARNG